MDKNTIETEFLSELLLHSIQNSPENLKPHISEIGDFRVSLTQESDRAVALMAAAFLEDYLARMISSNMIENSKVRKEVFDHNGSLGTFSAKIDIAYMLGLISQEIRKDLHLLRKIRNEFAHTAKPLTFLDHNIKSRCDELCCSNLKPKKTNPRTKFNRAMMIIAQDLALTLSKSMFIPEKKNLLDSVVAKENIQKIITFMKDKGMDASILENALE